MIKNVFVFWCVLLSIQVSKGQLVCSTSSTDALANFKPSALPGVIQWEAFPDFSLPFKIVYGGPNFQANKAISLTKGFSHISTGKDAAFASLPAQYRAYIYYGVAYNEAQPQPWQLIRSPWANNLPAYQQLWSQNLMEMAAVFDDTKATKIPAADILMLDIERHWEGPFELATNLAILAEKNNNLIPQTYRQLTDIDYIAKYKKDMQALYAEPLHWLGAQGLLSGFKHISSYADVPLRYQGLNIEANSWQQWQTQNERLSYIMKDSLTGAVGGSFYKQLNLLSPSCYIQDEYSANPKAKGGNYLAEALFQIEANKARSPKELMPFVWLRYENSNIATYIKDFQAEALAIFPFFSGATGLWLWDNPTNLPASYNYSSYEHFIKGLYRLSTFKDFFTGNYQLHLPSSARDLYVQQLPVWRGIVKDNKILIVAQNPYALANQETKLDLSYGTWKNTITLKGPEVYLCSFDLVNITPIETTQPHFGPKILDLGSRQPKIQIDVNHGQLGYEIYNIKGQAIDNKTLVLSVGQHIIELPILPQGLYLLKIKQNTNSYFRKIIIP
jgi:hypothetical protein